MTARNRYRQGFAAALIALVMLSYASVQSILMQTAMAFGGDASPICGATAAIEAATPMLGMAMGSGPTSSRQTRFHRPEHGKAACPYCAAAAHAPVITTAAPLRASATFVFAAFRVMASHGPRGPPSRQPRARGPPADPLTA